MPIALDQGAVFVRKLHHVNQQAVLTAAHHQTSMSSTLMMMLAHTQDLRTITAVYHRHQQTRLIQLTLQILHALKPVSRPVLEIAPILVMSVLMKQNVFLEHGTVWKKVDLLVILILNA